MFTADESPARVTTTPAASAHLTALAEQRGGVTVLLTDDRVQVLPADQGLPNGSLHLGRLDDSVTFAADGSGHTDWWRCCAEIDLTDGAGRGPAGDGITFALHALSEDEVYAALASGPLPRY